MSVLQVSFKCPSSVLQVSFKAQYWQKQNKLCKNCTILAKTEQVVQSCTVRQSLGYKGKTPYSLGKLIEWKHTISVLTLRLD